MRPFKYSNHTFSDRSQVMYPCSLFISTLLFIFLYLFKKRNANIAPAHVYDVTCLCHAWSSPQDIRCIIIICKVGFFEIIRSWQDDLRNARCFHRVLTHRFYGDLSWRSPQKKDVTSVSRWTVIRTVVPCRWLRRENRKYIELWERAASIAARFSRAGVLTVYLCVHMCIFVILYLLR